MTKKKYILITGGSKGIGKAIALKFAENNYNVFITFSKDTDSALATIKELNKFGNKNFLIKADFNLRNSVKEMIDSLLKETSSLDVLVNNAGWTKYVNDSDLESLPIEDFQKVVRINLESVFSIIKESISLLNNKESNIINISSIAGYNAIGSNIAYCAAKAGVISLTKSFAKILGPNIRVNGIAPGLTNTEMTLNSPEEYYEFQKKHTLKV